MMLQARTALNAGEKANYMSKNIRSLNPKFEILSPVEGNMEFEQIYSLEAHLIY